MTYPMLLIVAIQMGLIVLLGFPQLRQMPSDSVFTRLRTRLCQRYVECGVQREQLGTLEALTLGYREGLTRTTRRSFQSAGAMHVLAVSGLHTGLLYWVLLTLFTGRGRWKPMYEERIKMAVLHGTLLLLMIGYAGLTGFSPSVCRSVVMIGVVSIGIVLRRDAMNINTLAIAAFLILLVRPGDIYSLSFQLSFLAVAALLLIQPTNIVTVSLAAQLGTLPLCLYCFGQISNYFLPTNLIVIPLASVMMGLALAFFTIGWIPGLGTIIGSILNAATWLMNTAVGWVESLPHSVTYITIDRTDMLLLYAAILGGIYTMRRSLYGLIPTTIAVAAFIIHFVW